MNLKAFNAGCNAVCYAKGDIKYGMICAWAQMIDYDKITLLLGVQSVTGQNMQIGDLIGVSALSVGQEKIVKALADSHSNMLDKFEGLKYTTDGSVILVDDAKVKMKCEVIDFIHLNYLNNDKFVVLKVLDYQMANDREFISAYAKELI